MVDDKIGKGLGSREEDIASAIFAFIEEFKRESDRAAVILIAARVEYLLGELLGRFLLPNTRSSDELLDVDRPLGTFSSRIDAAYRLNLIDGEFARALHILRRMRNSFAHTTAGGSLTNGPNRDRVTEFVAPFSGVPQFHDARAETFKDKSPAAAGFYAAAALVVANLEVGCAYVPRVSGPNQPLVFRGSGTSKKT